MVEIVGNCFQIRKCIKSYSFEKLGPECHPCCSINGWKWGMQKNPESIVGYPGGKVDSQSW